MRKILCNLICLFLIITTPAQGAYFYVDLNGTRTSGESTADDWTAANCYGNISAAIQEMRSGDEVVINDGVYEGCANTIGSRSAQCGGIFQPPNGSDGAYTKIRARNYFRVFLTSENNANWDWPSRLFYVDHSTEFLEVEGINFGHMNAGSDMGIEIRGNHIKLRKSLIRSGPMRVENNVIAVTENAHPVGDGTPQAEYILFEDVAMVGSYRYGFTVQGYADYGNENDPRYIIFRRCVWRGDWSSSSEPHAGFAIYGNRQSASLGPNHIYYQNIIGVDGVAVVNDAAWKPYGPMYIFNGANDVSVRGSVFLNHDGTGADDGMFMSLDLGGTGLSVEDSIFWGFTDGSPNFGEDGMTINRSLFGGSTRGQNNSSSGSTITNSLFVNNTLSNNEGYAWTNASYNSFGSLTAFGTNQVTFNNDLNYLPRVDSTSNRATAGSDGGVVGPNILYQIGVSGTLYGEPGWDTVTDTPLWPWPYEDEIRDFFAVANPPVDGNTTAIPATNDTTRGFAGISGDYPLTTYIWEMAGNSIGDPATFDFTSGYIPGDGGEQSTPLRAGLISTGQAGVSIGQLRVQ